MNEEGSLRDLAGEPEPHDPNKDPSLKKERVVREAIKKVDSDLQKIESYEDISQLPLTLVNEVYRLSSVIENLGTQENLKFASDSKRRLLDSLIKSKSLSSAAPKSCDVCPHGEKKWAEEREAQEKAEFIYKEILQILPWQWERLDNYYLDRPYEHIDKDWTPPRTTGDDWKKNKNIP